MTKSQVFERSRSLKESASTAPGRYRIRIIEGNRMGSSGFYSREVIERDGPQVFSIGTHVFLDHLTETEEWDRPEGSVRNLAGVIDSEPVYEEAAESNGNIEGLYADVQFFPMYADLIKSIAPHVGMSIRALAEADYREVGNDLVPVITKLIEGISVDVVTMAGAGGKILQAIESAKPYVPKHVAKVLQSESDERKTDMTSVSEETAQKLVDAISALSASFPKPETATQESAELGKQDEVTQEALFEFIDGVYKKLGESDLTDASKARVMEAVKAQGVDADVDAAIKAELDYTKSVMEESRASGLGGIVLSEGGASNKLAQIKESRSAWSF